MIRAKEEKKIFSTSSRCIVFTGGLLVITKKNLSLPKSLPDM